MVKHKAYGTMAQGKDKGNTDGRRFGKDITLSSQLNDTSVRAILKEHTRNLAVRGLNTFHNKHRN